MKKGGKKSIYGGFHVFFFFMLHSDESTQQDEFNTNLWHWKHILYLKMRLNVSSKSTRFFYQNTEL